MPCMPEEKGFFTDGGIPYQGLRFGACEFTVIEKGCVVWFVCPFRESFMHLFHAGVLLGFPFTKSALEIREGTAIYSQHRLGSPVGEFNPS